MKKNISINLFGTLYNIDEDAYNLLENYLKSMQRYFGRQEGGEEIADDIEHRVAELLWKKREAGMTAVDINVVKEIIDTIGNAEDIASDDGNKSESGFASYNKREGNRQETNFKEDFKQFAKDAERFTRDTYDRGREHVRSTRCNCTHTPWHRSASSYYIYSNVARDTCSHYTGRSSASTR